MRILRGSACSIELITHVPVKCLFSIRASSVSMLCIFPQLFIEPHTRKNVHWDFCELQLHVKCILYIGNLNDISGKGYLS